MDNVTFLGPVGATFSHDAYDVLAGIFGSPMSSEAICIPAPANGEILNMIRRNGGYGAVAMETLAEGRVAELLESFIDLLALYGGISECPFRVVGAVRLNIHFCLMARSGLQREAISNVIAHPKALGACKARIASLGIDKLEVRSNGEAARLVSEATEFAECAALGPRSAAEKYGLAILDEAFEDSTAVTTFFLVAPASVRVVTGSKNRALIVYKVPHKPGALVKSLQPFDREGLNLIQIHSVHAGNCTYNFAIEIEVDGDQFEAFERAMAGFREHAEKHICFGPFEVVSR